MKRRNNMIRIFTMTVSSLLLMASCKESYPGVEFQPNPDEIPSNSEDLSVEKTPIKLYTNDPGFFSLAAGTRGTGAFDPDDNPKKYESSVFHVFAFRVGTGEDGTGGQDPLTFPVNLQSSAYRSDVSASQRDTANTSCLLDGPNYYAGMPYRFMPDSVVANLGGLVPVDKDGNNDPNAEIYYSGTYQKVGYTFYGYHIDDFEPTAANTHRTDSEIYYDLDLDGYRDIMLGYADSLKAEDLEKKGTYGDCNLTDEEKTTILGMYGGYSAFAGHRNVHPVLKLKHQLARFKFIAYSGDESAGNVKIKGISIMAPSKAKMVVAGRKHGHCSFEPYETFNGESTIKEFKLSEQPAEGGTYSGELRDTGYVIPWPEGMTKEDLPVSKRPTTTIGSSLLVAPAKSYEVWLYYAFARKDANGNDVEDKFKAVYTITPPNDGISVDPVKGKIFKPGVLYNIKIAVYGLQKIQMSATVNGWIAKDENGNDLEINIDPDDTEYKEW